jgi:catechol 2,3-dioxygenase-like lactoylglutathione lyase family enzyme
VEPVAWKGEDRIMKAKFVAVGIRVKDLQESMDFYVKLFGMKVVGRGRVAETKGEWVELASEDDGFTLELNYYESDSPYYVEYLVGEGLDHLTFKVDNLNEALKKAKLAGYPAMDEHRQGRFRWVYVEDPNGIWIQLY